MDLFIIEVGFLFKKISIIMKIVLYDIKYFKFVYIEEEYCVLIYIFFRMRCFFLFL